MLYVVKTYVLSFLLQLPTTAINSIGTGKKHFLLNFGLSNSLFKYNIVIVTTDIITAVQLIVDNLQKIS